MHLIHCQQGMRFATFSKDKASTAEGARLNEAKVVIEYTKGDKGKELVSIEVAVPIEAGLLGLTIRKTIRLFLGAEGP